MIENERGQWLAEVQKRDAEITRLRQQLAAARDGLEWYGINNQHARDTLAKLDEMGEKA